MILKGASMEITRIDILNKSRLAGRFRRYGAIVVIKRPQRIPLLSSRDVLVTSKMAIL